MVALTVYTIIQSGVSQRVQTSRKLKQHKSEIIYNFTRSCFLDFVERHRRPSGGQAYREWAQRSGDLALDNIHHTTSSTSIPPVRPPREVALPECNYPVGHRRESARNSCAGLAAMQARCPKLAQTRPWSARVVADSVLEMRR